jgi:excisionase family DNA binding protein
MAKKPKPTLPDQRDDAVSFNVETAARYVGWSAFHMETLCREGKIAAFKDGERWIIPRKALDHYVEGRHREVVSERALGKLADEEQSRSSGEKPRTTMEQATEGEPTRPLWWLREDVLFTGAGLLDSVSLPKSQK